MGDYKHTDYTLDPDSWEELRNLGHKMIDDMLKHLSSLRDGPVWSEIPGDKVADLNEDLPQNGQGEYAVYEQFLSHILPYTLGNRHPRFFGWVTGNGIPLAMLADMLVSGANPSVAGFNQAPALMEKQTLDWMVDLMAMPKGTSGVFTSGCTMANLMAMIVARYDKAGFNVRVEGMQENDRKMVFYCSSETHSWAKKAMEILGIGSKWLRIVPVNSQFQINICDLREIISKDREAGYNPVCVIGTAGTVNTGAVDDLEAIASIYQQEDMWFHIDGAFGAFAYLSKEYRHLVKGLQMADSIGFDLHKWMYFPFEIACLLVKDVNIHRNSFVAEASYLNSTQRGVVAGGLLFADKGIELTRSFKSLKVWMCLKAYGVERFANVIEQNMHQARYLENLIKENIEMEMLAPVTLNIVCFRYIGNYEVGEEKLNLINEELLMRLQESGIAVPSSTILGGKFAIRVANVNHRAKFRDFTYMLDKIIELGRECMRDM